MDILLNKVISLYLKNILKYTNILFIMGEVMLPGDCLNYMKLIVATMCY